MNEQTEHDKEMLLALMKWAEIFACHERLRVTPILGGESVKELRNILAYAVSKIQTNEHEKSTGKPFKRCDLWAEKE